MFLGATSSIQPSWVSTNKQRAKAYQLLTLIHPHSLLTKRASMLQILHGCRHHVIVMSAMQAVEEGEGGAQRW
jgi:hypothetical protein